MIRATFVLDTHILGIAGDPDDSGYGAAWECLNLILERHAILCARGVAWEEYSRRAAESRKVHDWISPMVSRAGKILWRDAALKSHHKSALLARKFHNDDLPFVALAASLPEGQRLLVTEDEDFFQAEVAAYLRDDLRIRLLRLAEALTLAEDP